MAHTFSHQYNLLITDIFKSSCPQQNARLDSYCKIRLDLFDSQHVQDTQAEGGLVLTMAAWYKIPWVFPKGERVHSSLENVRVKLAHLSLTVQ